MSLRLRRTAPGADQIGLVGAMAAADRGNGDNVIVNMVMIGDSDTRRQLPTPDDMVQATAAAAIRLTKSDGYRCTARRECARPGVPPDLDWQPVALQWKRDTKGTGRHSPHSDGAAGDTAAFMAGMVSAGDAGSLRDSCSHVPSVCQRRRPKPIAAPSVLAGNRYLHGGHADQQQQRRSG